MVQKNLTALVALAVSAGSAMAVSPEAQQLIDRAAADCQNLENGELDQGDAVTEIELRSQFGAVSAGLAADAMCHHLCQVGDRCDDLRSLDDLAVASSDHRQ